MIDVSVPSPFMDLALAEAEAAASRGEVPVGAVVVRAAQVVARAGNRMEEQGDPTAHAEFLAMRLACERLKTPRLGDCDLYVTLEPCAFCAAAISLYRLRFLYYGAYDPKGGAVDHGPRWFSQPVCRHRPAVFGGIAERRSRRLLQDFFVSLRR